MTTSLALRDIRKSYGSRVVLEGLNATFVPGRVACVLGANGAGKTTLLRIAAGLQFADSGVILAERVLYFGGFDFIPTHGTVGGLLRALGVVGAHSDGARKLRTLSRGELQSVGLRAAYALAPDVLLLDEPWTGLEPDAREALNEAMLGYAERAVVVASSHDLDEIARVADDVVVLKDGFVRLYQREAFGGSFDRDELLRAYRGLSEKSL